MAVHACNPSNEEAEAGESHISSQELIAEAKSWRCVGCLSCTRSLLEDVCFSQL